MKDTNRRGGNLKDRDRLTVLSLFTSYGLGDLGIREAGGECLVMAEYDAQRCSFLRRNYPGTAVVEGDIRCTKDGIVEEARRRLAGDELFLLVATRGAEGVKRLLGQAFPGIVGSDRWSAYNWLDPERRQLCWAHLTRDFQAFVERGGESARLGRALLACVKPMFSLWHRVRDGTLSRADFQAALRPVQIRVGELLREGTQLAQTKTAHTCANLVKLEVALWTFVRVAGVEPTNNRAERPLRRAVLWRRRSFGTQSEAGSRFVERILTTVTTLRQQKRDVLDYLTEACAAAVRGEPPPSLLPNAPAVNAAP